MRISLTSWILAALWLALGIVAWIAIPEFVSMFEEINFSLPILTRIVIGFHGVGWLLLSIVIAGVALVRDQRDIRSRIPDWLLVTLMGASLLLLVIGLFQPLLGCMHLQM